MDTVKTHGFPLKRVENEYGAVTIIVAVTLAALLAVAALAIDAGMLYQERRQLQTAVDAAALAAAFELAEGRQTTAEAKAREYVENNASSGVGSVKVTYPGQNKVRVEAGTSRGLFFARSFGSKQASLTASATATYGPVGSVSNLVPFLVPAQYIPPHIGSANRFAFELGEARPLPAVGGQGGYFWLCDYEPHGGGTPKFADWIINGYPGEVTIGSVANGTGVKAALKSAIQQRMSSNPNIIMPVYDSTEGMGANGEYHVVGFAEFVITGFKFQGNPKTISGYFTTGRVAVSARGGGTGGADFGVRTVWLTD
jgi:Flp pilus assembly protein TadG